MKPGGTASTVSDSDTEVNNMGAREIGPPAVEQDDSGPTADGTGEGLPSEETLSLRVRRVEAQLEALLSMGLPEDSPPSYAG
jgi:hypothetical protein